MVFNDSNYLWFNRHDIISYWCSTYSLKAKNERQSDNPEFKKAMGILIVSTVGYVGFVVLGDIFGVGGTDALFFQSVGMAIGGFILSMNHKTSLKSTALNLLPGVIWGIGNFVHVPILNQKLV